MTKTATASERITDEVTSWPGVEAGPGRRGEFAFRLGRRELGHLHGDRIADLPFPRRVRGRLADRKPGRARCFSIPAWLATSRPRTSIIWFPN